MTNAIDLNKGTPAINTANMASISLRPADDVLEAVMAFACSSGLYKLDLSSNGLYGLFMLALAADTKIEEKLEIQQIDKTVFEQIRQNGIHFNFDTDSRHRPVLPFYASGKIHDREFTTALEWDTSSPILHGLMVATFVQSFLPKLQQLMRACTPTYRLDSAVGYKINDLVILKNEFGGDAPAVIRYVYKELQCSADGTIFDLIVTPVATNRMIRAHSVDIKRFASNDEPIAAAERRTSENVQALLKPSSDVEKELARFFRSAQESIPGSIRRPIPGKA